MPWVHYIDQEFNCVVIVHEGNRENLEPLVKMKELVNHPDHREGMNILRDLRQIPLPPKLNYSWFSSHKSGLRMVDQKLGRCRLASVVSSEFQFGLLNQIRLMLDDTPVRRKPFKDMLEAKRWLGLPDDYRLDLVPNAVASPPSTE